MHSLELLLTAPPLLEDLLAAAAAAVPAGATWGLCAAAVSVATDDDELDVFLMERVN